MRYQINSTGDIILADQAFMDAQHPGDYTLLPDDPAAVDPCADLIDIGPFFDRAGAFKIPILADPDLTVQAVVKDVMARKWVTLTRADVGQAVDLLIAKGHAVNKAAMLATPVLASENFALRKTYFS